VTSTRQRLTGRIQVDRNAVLASIPACRSGARASCSLPPTAHLRAVLPSSASPERPRPEGYRSLKSRLNGPGLPRLI
jgi:hypothetical protein